MNHAFKAIESYVKLKNSDPWDIRFDDIERYCMDYRRFTPNNVLEIWAKGYDAYFDDKHACVKLCKLMEPFIEEVLPSVSIQDAFANLYNTSHSDALTRKAHLERFETEIEKDTQSSIMCRIDPIIGSLLSDSIIM